MSAIRRTRHRKYPAVKKVFLLIALVGIAAAGAVGWRAWSQSSDGAAQIASVAVARGDIEDAVTALGALQPRDYVDVGTPRSAERRVGKECVSTCRSRWSLHHSKKKKAKTEQSK